MSSRSLGELLLRPSTLSRISHPQSSSSSAIKCFTPSWTAQTLRGFSTSPSIYAAQPQPKRNAEPTRSTTPSETSQAIDDLFASMPGTSAPRRTPRSTSNSADELRAARTFGVSWSPISAANRHKRTPLAFDDMMPSPDELNSPSLANKPSDITIKQQDLTDHPRLNPSFGRTVKLNESSGKDFVRGISNLNAMIARNRVKADMHAQRFHERPGLKRKRLNSQRWRARFKKGFRNVTARVTELTRKGW